MAGSAIVAAGAAYNMMFGENKSYALQSQCDIDTPGIHYLNGAGFAMANDIPVGFGDVSGVSARIQTNVANTFCFADFWSSMNETVSRRCFEKHWENKVDCALKAKIESPELSMWLGRGGQIFSWPVLGVGDAIPPQARALAPWVDEVMQVACSASFDGSGNISVAAAVSDWLPEAGVADQAKQALETGEYDNFHSAGGYQTNYADGNNKESDTDPTKKASIVDTIFISDPDAQTCYSPLVGFHAGENSVNFVNLGIPGGYWEMSQAESRALLSHTRYNYIGKGVVEVTMSFTNSHGDVFDCAELSVPWFAIRTSAYPDMYLNSKLSPMSNCAPMMPGQKFLTIDECQPYTPSSIDDQFVALIDHGPLGDADFRPEGVEWVIEGANQCEDASKDPGLRDWAASIYRCRIRETKSTVYGKGIDRLGHLNGKVAATAVGDEMEQADRPIGELNVGGTGVCVQGILHPAWMGTHLYFFPCPEVTLAHVNQVFTDGLALTFEPRGTPGVTAENIGTLNAIGVVFPDGTSVSDGKAGVRVMQHHGKLNRDVTLFQYQLTYDLKPGESVDVTFFLVQGTLDEVKSKAASLKAATSLTIRPTGAIKDASTAATIRLFLTATGKIELIVIKSPVAQMYLDTQVYEEQCAATAIYAERVAGARPLYWVHCNTTKALDANPYKFYGLIHGSRSPCHCSNNLNVRPAVKLVGYTTETCEVVAPAREGPGLTSASTQYTASVTPDPTPAPTNPTPDPTAAPTSEDCKGWCKPDPNICTRAQCSGCPECADFPLCADWCGDDNNWANSCTLPNCVGCESCTTLLAKTQLCGSWCDAHSVQWTAKCKWEKCSGCGSCSSTSGLVQPHRRGNETKPSKKTPPGVSRADQHVALDVDAQASRSMMRKKRQRDELTPGDGEGQSRSETIDLNIDANGDVARFDDGGGEDAQTNSDAGMETKRQYKSTRLHTTRDVDDQVLQNTSQKHSTSMHQQKQKYKKGPARRVEFRPGDLGLAIDSKDWRVVGVLEISQAAHEGVVAGMFIDRVDAREPSSRLLEESMNGNCSYFITFINWKMLDIPKLASKYRLEATGTGV